MTNNQLGSPNTLRRASGNEIASFAEIIEVKDDKARRFYERESLLPLPDQPINLFRPTADIAKLFE